mgnify:CR=1 FL=1
MALEVAAPGVPPGPPALGVWGPGFRITPARVAELVAAALGAAAAITTRLGDAAT